MNIIFRVGEWRSIRTASLSLQERKIVYAREIWINFSNGKIFSQVHIVKQDAISSIGGYTCQSSWIKI